MATDLRQRLKDRILTRKLVAELAQRATWQTSYYDGVGPQFHEQNEPAAIVRHCKRDLRVLERHRAGQLGTECVHCISSAGDADPWPCDEIRDLADAYDLEVTDG